MRTRDGFISNSSSTSFVAFVPSTYKLTEDKIKEILPNLDMYNYGESDEPNQEDLIKIVDGVFNKFVDSDGGCCEDDDFGLFEQICCELDLIIVTIDTGSEVWSGIVISEKPINKILDREK